MRNTRTRVARVVRARRMLADGSARTLRQRLGVSLNDAGRVYGLDRGQLSRWERGLRTPHVESALKVSAMVDDLQRLGRGLN